MGFRDTLPIICLMPILLIYAVAELRRGWSILKYGQPSLNIALQVRIWLLDILRGSKVADEYRTALLLDEKAMTTRGIYSLVEGLIILIGSAILMFTWLW